MSINLLYLKPEYHDKIDEEVHELFDSYSSQSEYDDMSWYLDKLHRNMAEGKDAYSVYFYTIPEKYIPIIKQFAVLSNTSVRMRQSQVYALGFFLEFLRKIYVEDLIDVDRRILNRYEEHLRNNKEFGNQTKRARYSAVYKFFDIMESFPNIPSINPAKKINPFKVKLKSNNKKMVPSDVLKQYDNAMRSHKVPLDLRVVYWILRTIPNRINEVLSIQRNCLKPLFNHYNFLINTWKQNGGYLVPEVKTIPIKYQGHGKYLIDLIREQQKVSKTLSEKIESNELDDTEEKKKMLFLTYGYVFTELHPIKDRADCERKLSKWCNKVTIYSNKKFDSQIKTVAEIFDIRDKDGNRYVLKSHQLRHVNITMRLYRGYTPEQVSVLSSHKNINMLMNYNHRIEEKHSQISNDINKIISGVKNKPVSFKGKISNLDDKTIKILTASPRVYAMGQANGKKGVGICSSILGCKQKFECYGCDFFIPKAEYIDDYKAEYEYWEEKYKMFNRTKKLAEEEKAYYNMKLLSRIIEICECGIEDYKYELLEKIKTEKVDMNTPNKGGAISAGAVGK